MQFYTWIISFVENKNLLGSLFRELKHWAIIYKPLLFGPCSSHFCLYSIYKLAQHTIGEILNKRTWATCIYIHGKFDQRQNTHYNVQIASKIWKSGTLLLILFILGHENLEQDTKIFTSHNIYALQSEVLLLLSLAT